jgi:thiol:disulfide interchange protein DsbD
MKALSLIETAARDRRAHRQAAVAYAVGVIGSCLALGIMLLVLRVGGDAVGWGFQLQSPIFVSLLAYLFFAMALSLSGFVEFGARWMGVGESLTHRSGWQGSLFTGMLAMLAASPCTAPFMGTALGYAATQPPLYAITVFALLGLGLATPFLLIAWFPLIARLLPRPGPWMNGFRKTMSIPLYLTVVWLIWILARQAGPDAAAMALIGLVALGIGVSLWQAQNWTARGTRLAALAFALALAGLQNPLRTATTAAPNAGVVHEVWSAQRLSQLQSQGRTVFVNFTADWCLTCKVNERVALRDPRVQAEFARNGVVWLTADWTRPDPEIAEELARRGRDGVPLYVLFRPNRPPAVLPQILTPERVLESLAQAS